MNEYKNILRDCKVGIKAFQNVNASMLGFEKMLDLSVINDPILMPSTFYWSVIRYAKPFLNSNSENGKVRYPIKHIKHGDGFSYLMHKHLIEVRSALVAHDDFTEIPPRILKFGMQLGVKGKEYFVPTSITVSNKCISFPSAIETVKKCISILSQRVWQSMKN